MRDDDNEEVVDSSDLWAAHSEEEMYQPHPGDVGYHVLVP
jgi:hypothetical protein